MHWLQFTSEFKFSTGDSVESLEVSRISNRLMYIEQGVYYNRRIPRRNEMFHEITAM